MLSFTEADTCRKYVLPKLYASGWSDDHINEQRTFTYGRIVVVGNRTIRHKQERADYLLRYRPDFAIAIVEAKADYKKAADVAQAILGHSDMETTLGYTHVLPGWQREAMNRLEGRLLFPNVPKF